MSFLNLLRLRKPPVIIGGCGRSGTTLLSAILSCHPHIYVMGYETHIFCEGTYPTELYIEHGHKPLKTPFKMALLRRHLSMHPIPVSCNRWAEKTPNNIFSAKRILGHFKNRVKFINIVRDGRDVVTSVHPLYPGKFYVSPKRWVLSVQAGIALSAHPCFLTIRYEDIIQNYEITLKQIAAFLEETFEPFLDFPEGAKINFSEDPNKERVRISEEVLQKISEKDLARWKAPQLQGRIEELLSDPEAVACLKYYRYL